MLPLFGMVIQSARGHVQQGTNSSVNNNSTIIPNANIVNSAVYVYHIASSGTLKILSCSTTRDSS